MTGFTPEGQAAYRILDWTNDDQVHRLPEAQRRLADLAAPLIGQPGTVARRALAEVQDVGLVIQRLADAHQVTAASLASDDSIAGQMIDLSLWSDITPFLAKHHEQRNSHGQFQRAGGIAGEAMKIDRAVTRSARPLSNRSLNRRVAGIKAEHAERASKIQAGRQQVPSFSPDVATLLNPHTGDELAPSIARQALGPSSSPQVGDAGLDQRMIVAHARNAVNQIEKARTSGALSPQEASEVSKAVDSLAKSSLAAGRQLDQMRAASIERDARMDRLERALTEMQSRVSVNEKNTEINKQVNDARDERDELVEAEHARAARVRSTVMGVGSTLANAAFTIGSFFTINDSLPANTHEWMLAVIPLAAAVAQGIWMPLYEAHKDRQLEKSAQRAKQPITVLGTGGSAQFANETPGQRDSAISFLTFVFGQTGAPLAQAKQLATWLVDDNGETR